MYVLWLYLAALVTDSLLACVLAWFPGHFRLYREILKLLESKGLFRQRIFPSSPFAATTFNVGPQVVTEPHRDIMNLVFGICAVAVAGDFDHTAGGHLVFREAKVIMELRAGDVVLFPSAGITHYNIPLSTADEVRYSVVQYLAGGIPRWFKQGGMKQAEMEEHLVKAMQKAGSKVWEQGWSLFPTKAELEVACTTGQLPCRYTPEIGSIIYGNIRGGK